MTVLHSNDHSARSEAFEYRNGEDRSVKARASAVQQTNVESTGVQRQAVCMRVVHCAAHPSVC